MADYKNLSLNQLLNYKSDNAAWYGLGMAYMEAYDVENAIFWLDKTMNDAGNEWQTKATFELAQVYMADGHPKSSKDEALRLLMKVSSYGISQVNIGFLLYFGTETQIDTKKGRSYIEGGIKLLKERDGMNSLGSYDLLRVAWMYQDEGEKGKAREYLQATISKSSAEGFYDIKEQAEECLREL